MKRDVALAPFSPMDTIIIHHTADPTCPSRAMLKSIGSKAGSGHTTFGTHKAHITWQNSKGSTRDKGKGGYKRMGGKGKGKKNKLGLRRYPLLT